MKHVSTGIFAILFATAGVGQLFADDIIELSTGGSYDDSPMRNPAHWKKNGQTLGQFDTLGDYFVPAGKELVCPDSGGVSFACNSFAVAGIMRMKNYGSADSNAIVIPSLELRDGSLLRTWSGQGALGGSATVTASVQNPARISCMADTYNSAAQWHLVDWTVSGSKDAGLSLSLEHIGASMFDFRWTGDASQFFGVLSVICSDIVTNPLARVTFTPSDLDIGGVLKMGARTKLLLAGTSGISVGSLQLADGVILGGFSENRIITIANSFTYAGRLTIDVSGLALSQSDELELVHCEEGVSLPTIDDSLVSFLNANGNVSNYGILRWRRDANGSTLVLKVPVVVTKTDSLGTTDIQNYRSEFEYATDANGNYYWDDERQISPEWSQGKTYVYSYKNQVAPYRPEDSGLWEFPGERLSIESAPGSRNYLLSANKCRGMYIKDLHVINGCGIRVFNLGGYQDPAFPVPEGGTYNSFRLAGAVTWMSGTTTLECYGNNRFLAVESEMFGPGDLRLQTYPASSLENIGAAFEISGANTHWRGKLEVAGFGNNSADGYVTRGTEQAPNQSHRCRLFIWDERNLGGLRDDFAYDALSVHHFGELFLRDSVTLTDGCNRGVAFGDAATLAVTNGLTFTILRPVTWNGVVRKVGGGTLSLGNDSLRFGGADQLENPEFGKNVLSVEAGALQVTSASAADGLSIRMAEGTRLIVNADADADHALRLVRAGSALTTDAASGHFDVEFDVPDEPRGFTSVICVSSASNLEFRCKKPWKGYGCEVERRTVNGETTYLAKVELVGFVLVFR